MENTNELFLLELPNLGNEEVIKLTEQLLLKSEKFRDSFRIETNNIILDVVIKSKNPNTTDFS